MALRPVTGNRPPVPSTPTTPAAPASAQNTVAAPASSFASTPKAPTADLSGAASERRVNLGSITPGSKSVALGPIPLDTPRAQDAVQKALEALGSGSGIVRSTSGFQPKSVFVDDLGMTQVRLDRTHNGIKVFGEQAISVLDRDGKVAVTTGDTQPAAIPASVDAAPKLSEAQALAVAGKDFAAKPEAQTSELVIAKNANGEYVKAYHIELTNVSEGDPRRQNYLVDANTGKVIDSWNQIDTFIKQKDLVRAGLATEVEVSGSAAPGAPIEDLKTTTSTIELGDDASIEKLSLDLDIDHTWRGDLTVTVTSPSGKTVTLSDHQGGSKDDIKESFDLSKAFAGESTKGTWTLSVTDNYRRDTGTLNSWSLKATALKDSGENPPPPPPPEGGADDISLYSGTVNVGATQKPDGTWQLLDQTRGNGIETRDANNKSSGFGSTEIDDNNNIWGESTDPSRNAAAVDAQYGASLTYDFYKNILGRDSIDGAGEKLLNNVHINRNYVNAFWDGTQMNYGDGNGRDAGPLTGIDIAGHEITHGLTERTAGLQYRGESGGINESMSDIMGKGVEWMASQQNPNVKFTWGVGESVWTPGTEGDALRYMDDPTKDDYSVDNYKNYPNNTEVHGSSGIMNNAFVLLVQGGTNRTSGIQVDSSVGMEDALKIYGRALTTYMTPTTTFAQARQATIQAATDLFGADSVQVQKVKESWTAVGVA
jgi:Zn-dependent metalloprotease